MRGSLNTSRQNEPTSAKSTPRPDTTRTRVLTRSTRARQAIDFAACAARFLLQGH